MLKSFASVLLLLAPLASAQTFIDAPLVYPTTPIGETIWTPGSQVKVQWTILPNHPQEVTALTIELGIGQNTTVTGSGRFVAPLPGVAYPGTLEIDYTVPADLPPRQYALIFVGRGQGGALYGPNWTTWFTVGAGNATASTTAAPLSTTAAPTSTAPVPASAATKSTPTSTTAVITPTGRPLSGTSSGASALYTGLCGLVGVAGLTLSLLTV
ncbi:uncharacterized protein SPPG_02576 [Spizellomyces punctatus DAOM BR117]|uniref:Uncharacterized protein n=1 Tax=Spizellomyces punctatus (strain DAOM BR117) TaxID=645134 RepID=A0A0L0HM06_SPIPD|nr:uncharacterized protein SPPG_02576 [Spizellomyces punctatus DAOM BR117]KND02073.1 hypothetical protein SPPG_02576 [Spizellomyces punctatus DAOM BR117]|eukprot:XP_016610112.1 hypothetical protein SPPG_02576 [Spizellomyces punctatus DAOM BR117]